MKLLLDKFAAAGAVIAALAAAPACCLPLLAVAGAATGLAALAPWESALTYAVQAFAALAVAGAIIGFRAHRHAGPLAVALAGAASIFYAYNIALMQPLVLAGLGALLAAAVWNAHEARRCVTCAPRRGRSSTLTCPHCGHRRTETMPTDACQFFYECTACKAVLRPQPGDCCVFCSYGTLKCPPKQDEVGAY